MDVLTLLHSNSQNVDISDRNGHAGEPLVLAVDDDEDNLLLIDYTLQMLNFSVITAIDGHTALNAAQTYRPDLILLDIMLSNLDGIQVVSELKKNPNTMMIPVIAVTALARAEDKERILLAGCNDYISKPYMLEELEAIINRHLQPRSSSQVDG